MSPTVATTVTPTRPRPGGTQHGPPWARNRRDARQPRLLVSGKNGDAALAASTPNTNKKENTVDISVRTETFGGDDQSWLGSAHGTNSGQTVTLDKSTFTANTHYPNGFIPSGTHLAKITATGLYGPYDDAASDGRQTLVGYLLTPQSMTSGGNTIVASIFKHGEVIAANLPIATDANGKADVAGRIWYR